MSLKLELAQTVAIGAFNPYIITPEWLVRFGICLKDEEVKIRMDPLGEGAAFEFGRVHWQVENQRLIVSSSDRSVDCGGTVSKVLALLPHTPVQAVGHNFHFSATKEEWGDRPAPMLGQKTFHDLFEISRNLLLSFFDTEVPDAQDE